MRIGLHHRNFGYQLAQDNLHLRSPVRIYQQKVRKRDVSLQTITDEGTRAKDTFMTIVQTAKKLSVSAYDYIFDSYSRFEQKHMQAKV